MTQVSPAVSFALGAILIAYVGGMFALSLFVDRRITDVQDYIVAGRRLPTSLAWATLLATWFGAGTMLTAADEIRARGLWRSALEPLGAGTCLILAGLLLARPLWQMNILTLSDFFRVRFGARAEVFSALLMVPSYFGWIAVQFISLAAMLEIFFGIDARLGILLVAVVGTSFAYFGGMWSVTLTDTIQVVVLLGGLLILGQQTFSILGDGSVLAGFARLRAETPPKFAELVPSEARAFVDWLGVFVIGSLGNLPSQDLMQRIFAAKSAQVARRACIFAGLAYVSFGMIPALMGLASRLLLPEAIETSILPLLAYRLMSPAVIVVFALALFSAVISTIDSAILSPASVIAQNLLLKVRPQDSPLRLNRLAVIFVALGSLVVAYVGENAYSLLEDAYAMPLVSLFVPLLLGVFLEPRGERSALLAMGVGISVWAGHALLGFEQFLEPWTAPSGMGLPIGIAATLLAALGYGGSEWSFARSRS